MPDITFPGHAGENSIVHAMVRAPNAGRVFAHPGGFDDADQAHAHLTRWMTSPPEDHLRRLLDGPMTDVTDMYEENAGGGPDGRRLGEVVTDTVLVHALARLGVDPRAALVAMLFHAEEDVVIDGITILPSMIDQMATGVMTIHGYVMIGRVMDILTDRHRIDLTTDVPETLRTALVGHPVRDLVSHAIVDDLEITISKISEKGTIHAIDYDGGHDIRLGDIPVHPEATT